MTTVLNLLVLIAAVVVFLWILPYLYGLMQKRTKKEPLASSNEGYNNDEHAGGGGDGHGDGGADGSH